MSKSQSRVRLALALVAAFAMSAPLGAVAKTGVHGTETTEPNTTARLATYDASNGETTFALSLTPSLDSTMSSVASSDVVIYVDTSASQAGVYRTDSHKAVKAFLQNLNPEDRVKLFAVDLDAVAMTEAFVSPHSDEMQQALDKLALVTPLGSTDMAEFAKSAATVFDVNSKRPRNVVYIGDGISRAAMLGTERFADLVRELVSEKVSVSSFAIGPERDIELLAAFANHTGGNVFIDTDAISSTDDGAAGLSITVRGSVFWPASIQIPDEIQELLPKTIPPLRSDRDTIIIGSLKSRDSFDLSIAGTVNHQSVTMAWSVEPEESNGDFSFLPRLVQKTRGNGGVSLPTVGSAGLREVARVMLSSSRQITQLGAQVLGSAGASTAENTGSNNANSRVQDSDNSNQDGEADPPVATGGVIQDQEAPLPSGFDLDLRQDRPASSDDEGRMLELAPGTSFLDSVRAATDARNQQLESRVNATLQAARAELDVNPQRSIDVLKDMLDLISRTPDLSPQFQLQLTNRLTSALRAAGSRKEEFDANMALRNERLAVVQGNEAVTRALERREQQLKEWMDTFDSLMEEENYNAAGEVIETAYSEAPLLPETNAAEEFAPISRHWDRVWKLRRLRAENALLTLIEMEEASIPFSGNPPIVYPDPEVWRAKVILRKKWQNVRLSGNQAEEDILEALGRRADFDFEDQLFGEVIDRLREDYGLNIQVLVSAEDSGLTSDEPITLKLANISLRAGLRILLDKYDCTYVIKDEVLKIVSKDEAAEMPVTNIYNVADLIAPRQNFGGGGGGGQGGFGGGGQGGGGQGGFGGGGQGGFGGGGGGMFCIQDSLDQPQASIKMSAPAASADLDQDEADEESPLEATVIVDENFDHEASLQKWNQYFSENFADPSEIRGIVRDFTSKGRVDESLHVLQSAIQNGQGKPWMYQALVLALQIKGAEQREIERTVMSAVDMTDNVDDLMYAAVLMSNSNMEKRALKLLQEVAYTYPSRVEPFAIGLQTAQRINDLDGIQWATIGILSQAWPNHRVNVTRAMKAAEAVMIELQRQGNLEQLDAFNQQLTEALYRDCIVKVSWTGDADIDIYVEEPGGTVCSRSTVRTAAGGVMMGDEASSRNNDGEVSEYYVLPKGFSGDYRLIIRKIWGEVTSGKVTVEIQRNYRTAEQTGQRKQVQLDDVGAIVNFTLDKGRRTEFMEDRELQNIVENYRMSQKELAQTIDTYSSYGSRSAVSDYVLSRDGNDAGRNRNHEVMRRPPVTGFQPVITTLPAGTQMSAFAATADRLYVITAPSPLFTDIVSVSTFNFVGGGNGAGGAGGAGGVGGAGGLGGLGGGGGGGLF